MKTLALTSLILAGLVLTSTGAEPKRLLIVTVSTGFRHSSIELTEQVLRELAKKSGDIVVTSTSESPNYPRNRLPNMGGTPGLNRDQQIAINGIKISPYQLTLKAMEAGKEFSAGVFADKPDAANIKAKLTALSAAELEIATTRANTLNKLQSSANRLSAEQLAAALRPSAAGGGGGAGGARGGAPVTLAFPGQVTDATTDQLTAITALGDSLAPSVQAATTARSAFINAVFANTPSATDVKAKSDALGAAELDLAKGRAAGLAKLQATANALKPAQIQALAGMAPPAAGGRGGGAGNGNPNGSMEMVMQEYFAPDKLKNYDAMWFISTVGELPFPDRDAFFKWVADGHAVMGNHGASDSMHQTPEWAKMLGAEFQNHNSQGVGMIRNIDPTHPATAKWGVVIPIHEELYMFRPNNYDRTQVHSLLTMTEAPADGAHVVGAPGWFPVSWTKMYGNGRIFFTSLGHREDLVDPAWTDGSGQRINSPEVAFAVQEHYLGGMRWALGLAEGDTKPQTP